MCGNEREWILRGKKIRLCPDGVNEKLRGADLRSTHYEYYVETDRDQFPLTAAFAHVTGELRAGFTTQDAYRIFTALGFRIGQLR